MKIPIKELVSIVEKLNDTFVQTIWDETKTDPSFTPFEVRVGRGVYAVIFIDELIWDSENEQRKFIEESSEYEDIHDFIVTEACKILKQLNTGMIPLTLKTKD